MTFSRPVINQSACGILLSHIINDKYPNISFLDMVSYLVLQCSAYTMDEFRAYKSLEAYNQFVCCWVREIKVMNIEGKTN